MVKQEVLAIGLDLARRVSAKCLRNFVDSQLVARQLKGDYENVDPLLKQYHEKVIYCLAKFPDVKVFRFLENRMLEHMPYTK